MLKVLFVITHGTNKKFASSFYISFLHFEGITGSALSHIAGVHVIGPSRDLTSACAWNRHPSIIHARLLRELMFPSHVPAGEDQGAKYKFAKPQNTFPQLQVRDTESKSAIFCIVLFYSNSAKEGHSIWSRKRIH